MPERAGTVKKISAAQRVTAHGRGRGCRTDGVAVTATPLSPRHAPFGSAVQRFFGFGLRRLLCHLGMHPSVLRFSGSSVSGYGDSFVTSACTRRAVLKDSTRASGRAS